MLTSNKEQKEKSRNQNISLLTPLAGHRQKVEIDSIHLTEEASKTTKLKSQTAKTAQNQTHNRSSASPSKTSEQTCLNFPGFPTPT